MTTWTPDTKPQNVIQALAAVAADIDAVEKGRSAQGYKYRGIDDVLNALHGPMSRNGVVIVPVVEATERIQRDDYGKGGWFEEKAVVRYRIYGPAGRDDYIDAAVPASALDNSDKVMGKVLSYAFKSLAFQVFTLPTDASLDNEADAPPERPTRQEPTDAELAETAETERLRKELLDDIGALSEAGKATLREWMKANKLKLDSRASITRIGIKFAEVLVAESAAQEAADDDSPIDLVPTEHPEIEQAPESDRLLTEQWDAIREGHHDRRDGAKAAEAKPARSRAVNNLDSEQMKAVYAYVTSGGTQGSATPEQTKTAIRVLRDINNGTLFLTEAGDVIDEAGELYPKDDHAEAA